MHDDARVAIDRALLVRVKAALGAATTKGGHLAQRVTHEHLGYCGWRSESPRCIEHRALLAELSVALGRDLEQENERRGV